MSNKWEKIRRIEPLPWADGVEVWLDGKGITIRRTMSLEELLNRYPSSQESDALEEKENNL